MPEVLSASILGLATMIMVARMWLLNTARADRALNLAILLVITVAALRDHGIQQLVTYLTRGAVTAPLLNQLSEAKITLSAAAFLLLGLAWLNVPPSRWLSVGVWLVAGASAVAVQVAVALSDPRPAAEHGLRAGWAVIAYSGGVPAAVGAIVAHDALSYCFCLLLLVIGVRQIKRRPRGLELFGCLWVIVLVLGWFLQTLSLSVVTLAAATGRYSPALGGYIAAEYAVPLYTAAGFAAVAAIPVVRFCVEYVRVEMVSRILDRRLAPLWSALTAVCPEIVHSVPAHKAMAHPRYQLHLRVIEIRDAVMILSRHITDDMVSYSRACSDTPALQQAIRLQLASAAKLRGEPGPSTVLPVPVSTTADLIDDAMELLDLARWWPTATRRCASVDRQGKAGATGRPADGDQPPCSADATGGRVHDSRLQRH